MFSAIDGPGSPEISRLLVRLFDHALHRAGRSDHSELAKSLVFAEEDLTLLLAEVEALQNRVRPSAEAAVAFVFDSNLWKADQTPFYRIYLDALRTVAEKRQIRYIQFVDVPDLANPGRENHEHRHLVREVQAGGIKGVIVGNLASYEKLCWLKSLGIPVLGGFFSPDDPDMVKVNYEKLIDLGVDTLVSRGFRKIWLLGWLNSVNHPLTKVFRSALSRHGIDFSISQIASVGVGSSFDLNQVVSASRKLALGIDTSVGKQAVLSLDDELSRMTVDALYRQGILLGTHYELATHSNKNSPTLKFLAGRVIRLQIDVEEMADRALGRLQAICDGKSDPPPLVFEPSVVLPDKESLAV